jgi:hypothetical protein
MSHGADWAKENGDIPYEPLGADRPRLAKALRAHIVANRLDGSEHIARFRRSGRFKVPLPSGEDLLKFATFDERGKLGKSLLIRAFVSIPCRPDEPYHDIVDFAFVPEEWDAPAPLERTADEPLRVAKTTNKVRRQALAILAIGAALVAAETTMGAVSWAKKKTYEAMDWIDENTTFGREEPRISRGGRDDARQKLFVKGRVVDPLQKLPQEPLDQ